MIVNSQGNQTPYAELGKIDDMFTGIKFPGGTQAMKTYLKLEDVPQSLIDLKAQQGGNPYFIADDEKRKELSDFAKLNNLQVHFGVNSQDTIENQIESIERQLEHCPETMNLLLGSELYLEKWKRGEPTSNGVTRQVLLPDYLLYLETMIPICKERWPSLKLTIPGASYQINAEGKPKDKKAKDRKAWNSILKFWVDLELLTFDPLILTDYHQYIGGGIVTDSFDEEEVFTEVQNHFFDEITQPICTECGTYIEGPHPQNIEMYNQMLAGLDGDMSRFGIHVLYFTVANGYSQKYDRNFERHWFALFDPIGRTPKLEELREWHNDVMNIQPNPDPEPDPVVHLVSYSVSRKSRIIRKRKRTIVVVRWFWSDDTASMSAGILEFMENKIPTDDDIGKPKSDFQ
jgi:hypothetical protein